MNINSILRITFRITFTCYPLWILNFLLIIAFIPALMLSSGLGSVSAMMAFELPTTGPASAWQHTLRELPFYIWLLIGMVGWITLVITTALSWIMQAASMHGTSIAADKGSVSFKEALSLGRQRLMSLLTLSVIFGMIIGGLSLLPPLIALFFRGSLGVGFESFLQTALAPINFILGIVLLLSMMSIALEDLKPSAAFKRGFSVFKTGWWAFIFVVAASGIIGGGVALVAAVLIGIPVFGGIMIMIASPQIGIIVMIIGLIIVGIIVLALMVFSAVFTIVIYTLTYKEAARITS
jgi:hypothetical protein